jgi:hypothetical protein
MRNSQSESLRDQKAARLSLQGFFGQIRIQGTHTAKQHTTEGGFPIENNTEEALYTKNSFF